VGALAVVVASCGGGGGSTATTVLPSPDATRLAGRTDAETAAAVSAVRFTTASDVVIARASALPLGVGAAYIGGTHQSPILLTGRTTVPGATLVEIKRLGAFHAHIVGGAAIATSVDAQLRKAGLAVDRIGGDDPVAAAAEVAASAGAPNVGVAPGAGHTVVLAPVADERYALVAGPLVFGQQWPVLLTEHGALPDATRVALGQLAVAHVVVLGDESVIARVVTDALAAMGLSVERIAGPTPAAVAVALIALDQRIGLPPATSVDVVASSARADLLVAGPHAGPGSPILLCAAVGDCGPETLGWLAANRATVARVVVVGRRSAVSGAAEAALDAAAR